MKKWIGILLLAGLAGLAGCTPQGALTAWHWKAFVKAPDETTFAPLYADVAACRTADCPQGEQIDEEMIDDLADLVRSKDPRALKIALAADKIIVGNAAGAEYLQASYGPVIRDEPLRFLQEAAAAHRSDTGIVTVTPQSLIDNINGQYDELTLRREALMTVSDPRLVPLRDAYVAAIERVQKKLEPGLYRRPPAVAYLKTASGPEDPSI